MNNVVDEILQDDPKYRILDDEGNIIYDNISIELVTAITQIGTALNKALFDSIKNDLNSRLLITSKATQAEAEAGTNNTKYMTALRVKQALTVNKIIKTKFELSTSTSTTIDLTQYMTNAEKVEIIINAGFYGSDYTELNGTRIVYELDSSYGTDTSIILGDNPLRGICKITIYPKINLMYINSKFDSNRGTSHEKTIQGYYSYETLTNLVISRKQGASVYPSNIKNQECPAMIIQYKE